MRDILTWAVILSIGALLAIAFVLIFINVLEFLARKT